MSLIDVHAHKATYFKTDDSRPVMLFKVAKAMLTGEPPDIGTVQHVSGSELSRLRGGGEPIPNGRA